MGNAPDSGSVLDPGGGPVGFHPGPGMTRLANIQMAVLIGLLTIILALFVWGQISGRGTTHEQMLVRLEKLETEIQFQSCILLVPSEDRDEVVIARCVAP